MRTVSNRSTHRGWIVALLALVAGCGEAPEGTSAERSARVQEAFPGVLRDVLAAPDAVRLYALEPDPLSDDADGFHGYAIRGEAAVIDLAERARLIDALLNGIGTSEGTVAACFNPRHGLRISRGADRIDVVICFECLSMITYAGPDGERLGHPATTRAPEPEFDATLRRHGLTKAPP